MGFKLWTICTSDGFLYHAEPYCGSHTKISDLFFFLGLSQSANVVLGMLEKVGPKPGQHAVFDNYFESMNIMNELASKRNAATCTVWENRLSGAPFNPRKLLDTKERVFTGCISVVKWKDNKVVSAASNKLRSDRRKKA